MEFTGKTAEDAIEKGLKELGLTQEEACIAVIEEPVKGIFGTVKKPAKVEIKKNNTDGENAVEFLNGLFDKLDLEAKANLVSEGEQVEVEIIATDSAALIGYRGEILDAIQTLAGAVANIGNKEYKRVSVNCEGYREKREETLIKLAHRLEEKAVRYGRDISLEPMNPYERRIIHSALADSKTVTTISEGKEPNRYVIIVPNEKKPQRETYNKGGYNKDGYKKPYNREGGRNFNKNGNFGGRRERTGGFTDKPKRKTPSGFGTFLGNSFKDGE